MSLLRRDQSAPGSPQDFLGRQRLGRLGAGVTTRTALRHSAVWACLRLRANVISTFPLDSYRSVPNPLGSGTVSLEVAKPASLLTPSSYADGQAQPMTDWLYASQMDLDRSGNALGVITARDGQGLPSVVDLVPFEDAAIKVKDARIVGYKLGRTNYEPRDVWHERQYLLPGVPIGLSPIAYAAWSISGYLSAQAFAIQWFAGGAIPSGDLKFEEGKLTPSEAEIHKRRFMASVASGEPFVHGKDWTYTLIGAKASETAFLDEMNYGVVDVCRFLDVPGDMIDAPPQGSSVTYANVTQRNLQALIWNINPAVVRRETALSLWLPRPRFVKFNTDSLLRMDPAQRALIIAGQVSGKVLAPSEARELDNRQPFTPEQIDELRTLQILSDPKSAMTTSGGQS